MLVDLGSSGGVCLKDDLKVAPETKAAVGALWVLEHALRFPPPHGNDWLVGMAECCKAPPDVLHAVRSTGRCRGLPDQSLLQLKELGNVSSNNFLMNPHQRHSSLAPKFHPGFRAKSKLSHRLNRDKSSQILSRVLDCKLEVVCGLSIVDR